MIVKADESYGMTCPMALATENGGRCGGDKCMGWRSVGDGKGFCGMYPVSPLVELSTLEEVSHD